MTLVRSGYRGKGQQSNAHISQCTAEVLWRPGLTHVEWEHKTPTHIFHPSPNRQTLHPPIQNLKHILPTHKSRSTKWNRQFITCPIIIPTNLGLAIGDGDCVEGCYFWWGEVVEGCVDVPGVFSGGMRRRRSEGGG